MLQRNDPVLLLGMHRSGTTLLAQMLGEMGMHLGRNLEEHYESVFIIDANDWLLARAHGSWDQPTPMRWLLEEPDCRRTMVESLRSRVDSISFLRRYVGGKRLRAFAGNGPLLWGWKDPRTTATWPLWKEVFPRARAITVHRNGVDVAASLWRRARNELTGKDRRRFLTDPHLNRFASPRCLHLIRAFQLWEGYLDLHAWNRRENEIDEFVLNYEDLLASPREKLEEIAAFLGIEAAEGIDRAAALVKPQGRYRFLADGELLDFYRQVRERPWMRQLGYDRIEETA